jgi:hypothetical protein
VILVRTLLIWLLTLALPVQAVTAATMALCGPDHHGGAGSSLAQAATAGGHAHHVDAAHHAHDAAQHGGGHSAHATPEAPPSKAAPGDSSKCSACASCCSLAALPCMALAVPEPVFMTTVFSVVVPGVGAFAADGPERPPRTSLA